MPASTPERTRDGRGFVGGGRVLVWRGGSLWASRRTGLVQPHAHHAIQVTLAPHAAIRLRPGDAAEWQSVRASIVMPDQPHQFDGDGQDVVMVFVEPESTVGRRLVARFGHTPLSTLQDPGVVSAAGRMLEQLAAGAADEALIHGAETIIGLLAGDLPAAAPVDPRISRATDWIRSRLEMPITLAQAAAVAHLSPGRFRHLFVEQTGISFRAYLLWTRVNLAMATAMAGHSWTEAAQRAGFADSAHLTRTCRRTFGIAPTMLDRHDRASAT